MPFSYWEKKNLMKPKYKNIAWPERKTADVLYVKCNNGYKCQLFKEYRVIYLRIRFFLHCKVKIDID